MSAPTPVPPVEQDEGRRKKRIVMWGAVAAVGALITAAAFVDSEWADIGPGGGLQTGTFNLQTRADAQAEWDDWEGLTDSLPVDVTGELLLPGGPAVTSTYEVRNDSDGYDADLTVRIVDAEGNAAPNALRDALLFDVTIGGTQLADDLTFTELAGGSTTSHRLDEGADAQVGIAVSLDEDAGAEAQGGVADLHLVIDGEAVAQT